MHSDPGSNVDGPAIEDALREHGLPVTKEAVDQVYRTYLTQQRRASQGAAGR